MTRSYLRLASVGGAIVLSGVAMTPALAATTLSQSAANALTVAVAGNENGSGNVTASNDGSGEQKSGDTQPTIGVLGGAQDLFRGGALAQEAKADAADGKGTSAACAGLAGSGGSVVRIGESKCLSSGSAAAKISIANLDLSNTTVVDQDSALEGVDTATLGNLLGTVTAAVSSSVADANPDLANLGVNANIGAISAHCQASPGVATGNSDFADVNVAVNLPGRDPLPVAELKQTYPANTDLFVDLADVADVILKSVIDDLQASLGALAPAVGDPLTAGFTEARKTIVQNVRSQVADNLKPLSDNLLKLTLNKQSRPSAGAIRVNALDLQVLPAAKAQVGASLASVQIGNVVCGPSGREVTAAPSVPDKVSTPAIPTGVSAGYGEVPAEYAGQPADHSTGIILGAFAVLIATGAGAVTFRRLRA